MIVQKRMERAISAMREESIDAWITFGRATHFLTEPVLLYFLHENLISPCALIITASGEKICIVSGGESEEVESTGYFTQVIAYGRLHSELDSRLTEILKRISPLKKIALNICVDDPAADGLTYTNFTRISRCIENAGFEGKIVSSEDIVKKVRGQKSIEEIEKIAYTVSEAMKIYDKARPMIKAGMSGRDIQKIFHSIVHLLNYDYSWKKSGNPYVSVGTRSSYLCKRPPDDVYLQPGDLLNVDFGLRIDDSASDNQRSFYVLKEGETSPPAEVQRAFETIQAANKYVAEKMKPGVDTNDLLGHLNEVLVANGYPERTTAFGHELGIFAHEGGLRMGFSGNSPSLDPILCKNMVFTLEPAIITSCGRLCQEEVVVVTKDGGRFLSTPQKEIWLI